MDKKKHTRIYFKCPSCGHESRYALRLTEGVKSAYQCSNCESISIPEHFLLFNFLFGVAGGLVIMALVALISVYYLTEASVLFVMAGITPLAFILAWVIYPIFTRIFFHWIPK